MDWSGRNGLDWSSRDGNDLLSGHASCCSTWCLLLSKDGSWEVLGLIESVNLAEVMLMQVLILIMIQLNPVDNERKLVYN